MTETSLLRRHHKFSQALLNTVQSQDRSLVNNLATIESRKIYQMTREVGNELHRLKSFVRLEFTTPNILYTKIKSGHKIEDLLIDFFIERFPTMMIIIESNKGCFSRETDGLFTRHETTLKQTIDMLKDHYSNKATEYEYLEDFKDEYWSEFYNNQVIKTRKNKSLFAKAIPKKIRYLHGLAEERKAFSGSKQLSEFV